MPKPLQALQRTPLPDLLERLFGPDPGLLRLQLAGRTVVSAAISLVALLVLTGGAMSAAATIALGLMTGIFANMAVRDPKPLQQAFTLAALFVPAIVAVAIASALSQWPWAADLGFIGVVTGATLARVAGPRAMALGMVAYISYFIGTIIHPPLAMLPQLASGVAIGIAVAAVTRFVLLRDDPQAALRHVRRNIERRIDRILAVSRTTLLAQPGPASKTASRRAHYEIARLNDALLVAQDQIEAMDETAEGLRRRLWNSFFNLELSAERLLRVAIRHPDMPEPDVAAERIARLRHSLGNKRGVSFARTDTAGEKHVFFKSLDALERALHDVVDVLAVLRPAPRLQ